MKKFARRFCLVSILATGSVLAATQALPTDVSGLPTASASTLPSASQQPSVVPAPPDVGAKAYVLMDVNSGTVIAAKNMNDRMPPASLTKLMTMYLVSQALKNGTIKFTDQVPISTEAWQTGGSRMFVKVGSRVPVIDLVRGVIVDSGNDATMALAQFVGGSTDTFVDMMDQAAQTLGMNDSHFTDPTGLPAPDHYTTAYNLALLARAEWLDFPEMHDFYKEKWFVYNGIRQPNRNRLLWRYPYAVGMKTGHTDDAGFCLVGLAINGSTSLVAVVLNASSDEERADDAIKLLSYGFRFYSSHLIYQSGSTVVQPRVWYGTSKTVPAGTLYDVYLTAPQNAFQNAQVAVNVNPNLMAPIKKGQTIGSVNVMLGGKVIATYPLIALADNLNGGFFRKLIDGIAYHIHQWFHKHDSASFVMNIGKPADPNAAPAANNNAPAVQPLNGG